MKANMKIMRTVISLALAMAVTPAWAGDSQAKTAIGGGVGGAAGAAVGQQVGGKTGTVVGGGGRSRARRRRAPGRTGAVVGGAVGGGAGAAVGEHIGGEKEPSSAAASAAQSVQRLAAA